MIVKFGINIESTYYFPCIVNIIYPVFSFIVSLFECYVFKTMQQSVFFSTGYFQFTNIKLYRKSFAFMSLLTVLCVFEEQMMCMCAKL